MGRAPAVPKKGGQLSDADSDCWWSSTSFCCRLLDALKPEIFVSVKMVE